MSSKVSQKEYLKKYLSGDKKKHKSKKKRRDGSRESSRVKIIDDDVDVRRKDYDDDDADLLTGEDAPQIVGIIDERPAELKTYEDFKSSNKWKSLSSNSHTATESGRRDDQRKSHKQSRERSAEKYRKSTSTRSRRSMSKDLSPARKRRRTPDETPQRDQSPPRRQRRDSSDDRRHRKDNNAMYEEKSSANQNRSDDDLSPVRKKKSSDGNADKRNPQFQPTMIAGKESGSLKITKKTLDGKTSGLQSAKMLRDEAELFRKKENEMFEKISSDMSGRGAEAIVRNKFGRLRNSEERKNEDEKKERENQRKRTYSRWGKGLKQIEELQTKVLDDMHEMSKPLARYSDDADLDSMLKSRERVGDPMLDYIRKKADKNKTDSVPSVPVYKGSYPENRFNIRPGYRWDGVDRSNGYEQKWFDVQSQKKALQEEAYKYSTEDM